MKLRIKDNSLRLRLSQSEVQEFGEQQCVTSTIHFPMGSLLSYSLMQSSRNQYDVDFNGGNIRVFVPKKEGINWLEPENIGMEHLLTLPSGEQLRLLIEKDFQCLTERPEEDESDLFPNPNQTC